ncbi:zinc metalloprotease egy2 chloroplastic [Sarracenia purpurea var. burkii]
MKRTRGMEATPPPQNDPAIRLLAGHGRVDVKGGDKIEGSKQHQILQENGAHEDEDIKDSAESISPVIDQNKDQFGAETLDLINPINVNGADTKAQGGAEDQDNVEVANGSALPGVKPQQLDESIRIPKETIEIIKDQVFGFDTFFVTSQEPYEVS